MGGSSIHPDKPQGYVFVSMEAFHDAILREERIRDKAIHPTFVERTDRIRANMERYQAETHRELGVKQIEFNQSCLASGIWDPRLQPSESKAVSPDNSLRNMLLATVRNRYFASISLSLTSLVWLLRAILAEPTLF